VVGREVEEQAREGIEGRLVVVVLLFFASSRFKGSSVN